MPWLLAIAAALVAGGYLAEKAGELGQRAGVFPPDSQTTEPEAAGTIGRQVDKVGSSASAGLLLVSAALAYSLVKR